MSRAARSVFVFGLYLIGTAAVLALAPNVLLGLLGIELATEPWIRVLGVVVGALGAYYIVAARAELDPFFRASVWARALVLFGFCGLAAFGWAPVKLIGFGVLDALGAFWTWTSLRAPRDVA
ncbi:MAG: hypothetical protein NTW72_07595 [Gemmatimonadetes bacterium]|nr:hypothetical protein [Gemmatimonadota bacterium]